MTHQRFKNGSACESVSLLHDMENIKIYKLATECDRLFRKAVPEDTPTADLQVPLHIILRYFHDQFKDWAGWTRAFEDGRYSLDRRVRSNFGLRRDVIRLLALIKMRLIHGKAYVRILFCLD